LRPGPEGDTDRVTNPGRPPEACIEAVERTPHAAATARLRLPHLDNLRTVMIGWIIGGHALLGYMAIGGWPYDEVHEISFHPVTELTLTYLLGPTALFVIGTFFFVSGLLAEIAMARKGPARFAADRLLRLGVPYLAFMALLWPLFMWFAYLVAGHDVSYWWAFTHRQPFLDSGPLWFAEVLLYVSLGYAAWRWVTAQAGRRPSRHPAPLHGGHLVALTAGVLVASFLVRLWFPARSTQVLDLHLWQWPQCVAMFALGVAAARRDWHLRAPRELCRACGWAVVAVLVAAPVIAVTAGVTDVAADAAPFLGGTHWQAVVLAGVEACLVVAGSVWLCGLAQRRLAGTGRRWTAWGRASYAAFLLQVPVLLTLAMVLRPMAWPAEGKAAVVAGLGVPVCFWLGRHLTGTGLRRIV
jgi:peptidoglycan/LPS O-acetylase OafA/YrhL